jgi:hypothetical protein
MGGTLHGRGACGGEACGQRLECSPRTEEENDRSRAVTTAFLCSPRGACKRIIAANAMAILNFSNLPWWVLLLFVVLVVFGTFVHLHFLRFRLAAEKYFASIRNWMRENARSIAIALSIVLIAIIYALLNRYTYVVVPPGGRSRGEVRTYDRWTGKEVLPTPPPTVP